MDTGFLAELSKEDLEQRFSDSYIFYNGSPKYCQGFGPTPRGMHIFLQEVGKGMDTVAEKFDPALMVLERPRAQYYFNPENNRVFRVLYPTRKQFCRGVSQRNTMIELLSNGPALVVMPFWRYIRPMYYNRMDAKIRLTISEFFNLYKEETEFLMSPCLAVSLNKKGVYTFYYRGERLGYIKAGERMFLNSIPRFDQEVSEVLIDVKIKHISPKDLEPEPKKNRPLFKPVKRPIPRGPFIRNRVPGDEPIYLNRIVDRRAGIQNYIENIAVEGDIAWTSDGQVWRKTPQGWKRIYANEIKWNIEAKSYYGYNPEYHGPHPQQLQDWDEVDRILQEHRDEGI